MKLKAPITRRNIVNVVFIIIIGVLLFVPQAKAFVLTGLIEVGFLKPDTGNSQNAAIKADSSKGTDLSGITFKDGDGKETDLGDLKGKVIFLNFWATWCPPCQAEMPSVNKLYGQFRENKNIVFIMVDADSDYSKAKKYMDRKKFSLPVYTLTSSIPDQLFSGSLPTTIVFDKQGRISLKEEGAANYADEKFIAFIKKLAGN